MITIDSKTNSQSEHGTDTHHCVHQYSLLLGDSSLPPQIFLDNQLHKQDVVHRFEELAQCQETLAYNSSLSNE